MKIYKFWSIFLPKYKFGYIFNKHFVKYIFFQKGGHLEREMSKISLRIVQKGVTGWEQNKNGGR